MSFNNLDKKMYFLVIFLTFSLIDCSKISLKGCDLAKNSGRSTNQDYCLIQMKNSKKTCF